MILVLLLITNYSNILKELYITLSGTVHVLKFLAAPKLVRLVLIVHIKIDSMNIYIMQMQYLNEDWSKWAMMIAQEKKSYYWTMISYSGCGQVEVMEWLWLALVWVMCLLGYNSSPLPGSLIVKLQNLRVPLWAD